MDFQKLVEEANLRLRGRRCRCRIELRKKALVLRATLPSKDGSQPKQQRVAIGVPATATGLADAEFQALRLDSDLRSGNFCWSSWSREESKPRQRTAVTHKEFLQTAHELHARKVQQKEKRDPKAIARGQESWRKRWSPALNKLRGERVTQESLLKTIRSLGEGSAVRRETALVLGMVAGEIGWDQRSLREAGSGYGRQMLRKRDIPSDRAIEEAFDKLMETSPHWGRIWGLVATYGARPSELGTATLREDSVLIIPDSKTNRPRAATPTKTEWVDRFRLHELPEPPGKKDGYSISTNCNAARRRCGIEIPLYSLRHAAAIRLLAAGVPAELAAKLLGHSAAMFNETYTAWISEETIVGLMASYKL